MSENGATEEKHDRSTKISERKLAAIVVGASLVGGLLSTIADSVWIDAGVAKETDAKMIELAIGILNQPIKNTDSGASESEVALRTWAVDLINAAAEVPINPEAAAALSKGQLQLVRELEQLRAKMQGLEDTRDFQLRDLLGPRQESGDEANGI